MRLIQQAGSSQSETDFDQEYQVRAKLAYTTRDAASAFGYKLKTFQNFASKVRAANIPGFEHPPGDAMPPATFTIYEKLVAYISDGCTQATAIARTSEEIAKELRDKRRQAAKELRNRQHNH